MAPDNKFISSLLQFVYEQSKGSMAGGCCRCRSRSSGRSWRALRNKPTSKGVHAEVPEFEVKQAIIHT